MMSVANGGNLQWPRNPRGQGALATTLYSPGKK